MEHAGLMDVISVMVCRSKSFTGVAGFAPSALNEVDNRKKIVHYHSSNYEHKKNHKATM